MAVLVTRPHPDDETTAASLRARGFEVLRAPMLRFEPVAVHEDMNARYSAVIVTSANALRGIEPHLKGHRMLELPLFAVGEHTAAAARRAGFTHVVSANADAANLRDLVLASLRAKELKKASVRSLLLRRSRNTAIAPRPIDNSMKPMLKAASSHAT